MTCLFCSIVKKEVKSKTLYEDNKVFAFHDIAPKAPVHFLVIPKKHIHNLNTLLEEDIPLIGYLFFIAKNLANELNCNKGFRSVINCNKDACQTIDHLHLHILGKRQMCWPPG